MAENFDLIFGQNASQQYAWNDADYQNGWETIGNIPPTAAQFDALQRRSDTKMKELNDELTPLVNAETADNRQPSTAYSQGDIKYSPLLPTGWFLACTVSGTSSASELVVPSPVAEGDEITDGGVTWKVKKIGGAGDAGDGVPLGAILPLAHNSTLPAGYLLCDGSAVSRTMFPDLFSLIGTTYGAGDGSTTFNLPDYNAAERFVQGDTVAGTVKTAGLPNIEGNSSLRIMNTQHLIDGCFTKGNDAAGNYTMFSTGSYVTNDVVFDASLSNAIYGASTTVQPNALTARYIIKAYDGVTPTPAEADISQMLTELTGKADRDLDNLSAAGEARLAHVVVDSYYDDTTGDWWREYADGWVEQGGVSPRTNSYTITFLRPFADTHYALICSPQGDNAESFAYMARGAFTTTSATITAYVTDAHGSRYTAVFNWVACGMKAQS